MTTCSDRRILSSCLSNDVALHYWSEWIKYIQVLMPPAISITEHLCAANTAITSNLPLHKPKVKILYKHQPVHVVVSTQQKYSWQNPCWFIQNKTSTFLLWQREFKAIFRMQCCETENIQCCWTSTGGDMTRVSQSSHNHMSTKSGIQTKSMTTEIHSLIRTKARETATPQFLQWGI